MPWADDRSASLPGALCATLTMYHIVCVLLCQHSSPRGQADSRKGKMISPFQTQVGVWPKAGLARPGFTTFSQGSTGTGRASGHPAPQEARAAQSHGRKSRRGGGVAILACGHDAPRTRTRFLLDKNGPGRAGREDRAEARPGAPGSAQRCGRQRQDGPARPSRAPSPQAVRAPAGPCAGGGPA